MAIDGIIIVDNTGRPILQSGFRSKSPAYPLLHVDALNHALSKCTRPEDVEPVIYVPPHNLGPATACCHIKRGDIRLLCPVSGDVDPLFAFAFVETFADILHEYFGNVSASTLKENFDVVYQLLEETLDSEGHPLTTSSNALRDIVIPPSLLSKLLNVAGANLTATINSGSGLGAAGGPFSSPIPWRKAGLRYASNEIYFDIVENLSAIVNKNGTPLSSNVWGKIEMNAKLSGTPDCLLTFTNPYILSDCAFHPCVRLQRWSRDKTLSFIPPDGRFVLADYRYSPNATAASTRLASTAAAPPPTTAVTSIAKEIVPLPLNLKTAFQLEEHGGSFDITLTSRLTTRPIENYVAELDLGEGASGIKCVAARGSGIGQLGGGIGGLDAGIVGASWTFDSSKKILKWEIPSIPPSSSWNLRGSFTTPLVLSPRPSHALQIHFEIPSHTFSAIKVEQLKITGELYKPFKGVRGRTTGNIEWRW